jgi:hypothetical protein
VDKVTKVHIPFLDPDCRLYCRKQLDDTVEDMKTLKRVFPSLTEVVGSLGFTFDFYKVCYNYVCLQLLLFFALFLGIPQICFR